jgi:hypothetical protein
MPNFLWIWDISLMKPIVLIYQISPIRHFYWNPINAEQLVICCGNEKIYFWSGQKSGAEIIEVPAGKQPKNLFIHYTTNLKTY